MQGKKNNGEHFFYFTKKMNQRMKQLIHYPATLVEAPMGYGKTTLIAEAMSRMDTNVIWQKIYDRTADDFWAGLYQSIAEVDMECAQSLAAIGLLKERFLKRELMQILESLHITRPTFLIIDDYHYVKSKATDEFLTLLITHMPEHLHLIIISRIALNGADELQLKGYLNKVGIDDLIFGKADIEYYYHMQDIRLDERQLEQLCSYSEGWISALYLFLLDYRLHGSFVFTSSVPELVFQTIYDLLDDEMKHFLLAVCQFDVFSLKQAKTVWQQENAEELLNFLLASNAFITRDDIHGRYSLHNIFRLCVQEQFGKRSEKEQRTLWKNTGNAMQESGLIIQAMECYYHAGYYEGVLEMMGKDNPRDLRNEHKALLLCCYDECPEEVKLKYPLTILTFCMDMTTQFYEAEWFLRGCLDFENAMKKNRELTDDERAQLLGEYELILSYHAFNDLHKMRAHHKKAFSLLKSTARFIFTRNTFCFGAPSVLYLYYRRSGGLAEYILYIRNVPGHYVKCARGHGAGFPSMIEAEFLYNTGDYYGAEIAALEGISLAKAEEQADMELMWSVCISKACSV